MKKPLISVILPVLDNERYLKEAILSLKKQSFRRFEVIAIDDASRDNSWQVLKKAVGKDKRFRLYKNKARYGLRITLARATKKVRGEFIALAHPNSINYQKRLATQLKFLEANNNIGAVGTQAKYINFKAKILASSSFPLDAESIQKDLIIKTVEPWTIMVNKRLLPKDIFRIEPQKSSLLFPTLLLNIAKYTQISNLERPFVYIRKVNKKSEFYAELDKFVEYSKVFMESIRRTNKIPSFKALLEPLLPTNS